jgi:hypothetical protein
MCQKEHWKSIQIIRGEVPLRELKQNWRRFRRELKILIWITIFYIYLLLVSILTRADKCIKSKFANLYNLIRLVKRPKTFCLKTITRSSYIKSEQNVWDGLFLFQLMLECRISCKTSKRKILAYRKTRNIGCVCFA